MCNRHPVVTLKLPLPEITFEEVAGTFQFTRADPNDPPTAGGTTSDDAADTPIVVTERDES